MKGKIGQSLSLGLPLVTTSIGAEGMRLEHGRTALIADDPKQFADAVVTLYKDEALWESVAANGVRHIEDNFSYAAVRSALKDVFAELDENATGAEASAA
jgi:glycosyltransferase involved in cell wall biosynthesis